MSNQRDYKSKKSGSSSTNISKSLKKDAAGSRKAYNIIIIALNLSHQNSTKSLLSLRQRDKQSNKKKCEEEWHLNGKAPSAIDTFSALNVCFNDISWIIRKVDKRSFIYEPNKKWLESTKMNKTGDELYGIARSYKDSRVN
jgi:hypothetical protein